MGSESQSQPGKSSESSREEDLDRLVNDRPLAVLLIGGENDLGPRSFRLFEEKYRDKYDQVLFVAVGELDASVPRRDPEKSEEAQLLNRIGVILEAYVAEAHALGMKAAIRIKINPKPIDALESLASNIAKDYPKSCFFLSKLAFKEPRWFHPFLFGGTADKMCELLRAKGYRVTVLPVVV
jgi:hypothetical protein